jgi:hypothetical protein
MLQPWHPISASPLWLFSILVLLLVGFDLVLVRWLRLGKVAWKRVDYIWLIVAALGLYGAAADVRRTAAANSLPLQHDLRQVAYLSVVDSVRFMTGPAVCREFVRSNSSPKNFDEVQVEFNRVCTFARTLAHALPTTEPKALDRDFFLRRPPVTESALRENYQWLDQRVEDYLTADRQYSETVRGVERTSMDLFYAAIAPVLLVVALALRITKVTGEIRLERQTNFQRKMSKPGESGEPGCDNRRRMETIERPSPAFQEAEVNSDVSSPSSSSGPPGKTL